MFWRKRKITANQKIKQLEQENAQLWQANNRLTNILEIIDRQLREKNADLENCECFTAYREELLNKFRELMINPYGK